MREHLDLRAPTRELLTGLARSTAGGITAALEELKTRPDLPETARALLAHGTVDEKVFVLLALRGLTGPQVVSIARGAVRDANPRVRGLAVQVMTALGDEVAADLVAMLDDPDPQVVLRAIAAASGAARAPELLRRLILGSDEATRLAAIELAGRRAIDELRDDLRACLADPSPRVRGRAMTALGALGGPTPDEVAPTRRDPATPGDDPKDR